MSRDAFHFRFQCWPTTDNRARPQRPINKRSRHTYLRVQLQLHLSVSGQLVLPSCWPADWTRRYLIATSHRILSLSPSLSLIDHLWRPSASVRAGARPTQAPKCPLFRPRQALGRAVAGAACCCETLEAGAQSTARWAATFLEAFAAGPEQSSRLKASWPLCSHQPQPTTSARSLS